MAAAPKAAPASGRSPAIMISSSGLFLSNGLEQLTQTIFQASVRVQTLLAAIAGSVTGNFYKVACNFYNKGERFEICIDHYKTQSEL
jgi:hypothetical protein